MSWIRKKEAGSDEAAVDFLPDADEIEQRPLPRSARITLHALLAVLFCFVVWAAVSEVDLVVVARGRLVTPLPNIVVQPLETSIIQQINVRQGQIVRKGEPLATLDPTFTAADEAELKTRLHSLNNQLEQLEGSLSGRKVGRKLEGSDADSRLQVDLSGERQASYGAQVRKLRETVEQTRAAMETNRRDQQVLASRVKVLRDMAAMQEQLVAEKYAIRSRLLEAQDRLLDAERSLQLATNKDAELRRVLAAQEAEKASFETGWRQKLMEEVLAVSRERDAVAEQLQKAGRRHRMVVLSSPSDAVVLDIAKLSQGSVAKEAEPLFTLVPLGATLEAEVEVDSLDVGYLKVGDLAHLKFDAYPFQRHGTVPAHLRIISEDAFRKEAAGSATAFYTSRLQLDGGSLKRMPEQARLLPGMTLSAEIVVGKRSVMSYLVWPLVKALDESIREP